MTSMYQYLFLLGHTPLISLAELAAVQGETVEPLHLEAGAVTVSSRAELPMNQLINRLGGTVGIAQLLVQEVTTKEQLTHTLLEFIKCQAERNFGLVVVGQHISFTERDRLGILLKQTLRQGGQSRRFVTQPHAVLPSPMIYDQLLPPRGVCYVMTGRPGAFQISRLAVIQNVQAWSTFDYGRPVRDPRRGMLPPKLARILLNLSRQPIEAPLLDPFCGVGTVLQEAARLGYQTLIGSDQDDRAVQATAENMAWLRQQVSTITATVELVAQPIATLRNHIQPVRTVVTEGYLGPPDIGRRLPSARVAIFTDVAAQYEQWLGDLARLVQPEGIVILAYPLLLEPKTALPIAELAQKKGWRVEPFFTNKWQTLAQSAATLDYAREDQHIGRSIIRLRRVTL